MNLIAANHAAMLTPAQHAELPSLPHQCVQCGGVLMMDAFNGHRWICDDCGFEHVIGSVEAIAEAREENAERLQRMQRQMSAAQSRSQVQEGEFSAPHVEDDADDEAPRNDDDNQAHRTGTQVTLADPAATESQPGAATPQTHRHKGRK